jgi:hypothetical protein
VVLDIVAHQLIPHLRAEYAGARRIGLHLLVSCYSQFQLWRELFALLLLQFNKYSVGILVVDVDRKRIKLKHIIVLAFRDRILRSDRLFRLQYILLVRKFRIILLHNASL